MQSQAGYFDSSMLESGVWIHAEGERRISAVLLRDLLDAVADGASLSAAARACKVSYRHAWGTITDATALIGRPLLETSVGGVSGGGSTVTAAGEAVRAELAVLLRGVERALERTPGGSAPAIGVGPQRVGGVEPQSAPGEGFVLIAVTYEVVETGLLDALGSRFFAETGIRLGHIAAGSGAALSIGKSGRVDAVLSHAPELELPFIEQGWGLRRIPLMRSRFVIIGPDADPAGVQTAAEIADPLDAMRRIAAARARFVSRGDNSGTHVRELALWRAAGITPGGAWYRSSYTSGNTGLLELAARLGAYAVVDSATIRRQGLPRALRVVYHDEAAVQSPALENRFTIIPTAACGACSEASTAELLSWMQSNGGEFIPAAACGRDGRPLFEPIV